MKKGVQFGKQLVSEWLSPYVLNWSGDVLDSGGLVLSTMQTTSKSSEADIVINQYGSMGASGILEVEEALEDPTDSDLTGFSNSVNLEQNKVYLIVLHDGSFAKIRIDRILPPTKVFFSYVLQTETSNNNGDNGSNTRNDDIPTYVFLEGEAIVISWEANPSDVKYEIYRSDNGADYVKLTDFSLKETSFTDKYALGGHTYYYLVYAYDNYNNYRKIGPLRAVINFKTDVPVNLSEIVLQIDNKIAYVNGNRNELDVAPFILDGRTMVPIRFISEALGATVEWNNAEQKITLTSAAGTIELWVDSSEAVVNGQTEYLDVPAKVINDRTMVPIRFISENMKQTVSFDNETLKITITGEANSGSGQTNQSLGEEKNQGQQEGDVSLLFGTWGLWVPGGFSTDGQYVNGADSGTLIIHSDGTYSWQGAIGGSIEGTWNKTGTANQIELLKGEHGWDWYVTLQDDGTIRVNSYGVYSVGTKIE